MKSVSNKLLVAVAIGLLGVLPFVIVEGISTKGFSASGFPAALFGLLWVLGSIFTMLVLNTVSSLRVGMTRSVRFRFMASTVLLVLIAVVWIGIVLDQSPCFLGAPNCD